MIISRKLHENVVQNLIAEKDQQCSIYSLWLKFVKLVSLLMYHEVSVLLQYVPENIEAVVAKSGVKVHRLQLDIILKMRTFQAPVYVEFCEKISV